MTNTHLLNMQFFTGSSHPILGKAIADELNIEQGKITLSRFSCGETYTRITESIRGRDVYILQTVSENVNDDFMELFIMMDAFKKSFLRVYSCHYSLFWICQTRQKISPKRAY